MLLTSYKTAKELLSTLPQDKVLKRLGTLTWCFNHLIKPNYDGVYLNSKVLRHAVECSLLDLQRMKIFHGIDYADAHKRAAFTMVWIARTHPVQLQTDINFRPFHLVINELFAVLSGLMHMKIKSDDISREYLLNLVYSLHYRYPSPEIVASMMYAVECAVMKKAP